MKTVEILAGGNFAQAVYQLKLMSAMCTYHYHPPKDNYREEYQVWLLSDEDFQNLCAVDEAEWQEDWGWWRHALGSNMGGVDHEYIINGEKIRAWDGYPRTMFYENNCAECSDRKDKLCDASEQDQIECSSERKYSDLLEYFCEEIGASTEKNVCALAIDLAKQNDMKLSELFKKYLGGYDHGKN